MTHFLARAALAAALLGACGTAAAQEALRPEVGKPLARAKQLLAAHQYAQAQAQVRAASSVRGLTANESFIIEEMRGAIAQQQGDVATASKTYADMLASGRVPAGEQAKLFMAEASMAYQMKNYPNVVAWTQKYLHAGGNAPEMRGLLIQAYYLQGDYANAAKLQSAQIAAATKAGQRPTEQALQLLARCQEEMHDTLGFGNTMTLLVTYYPKPDYWQNLIHSAQTRPGFNSRLQLDIDRFELAIGLITKPADLMDMTELALQVPLPGEAKAVVDRGFASGALGTGPEAARQQRLRALVQRVYADEQPKLASRQAEAQAAHDGNASVALGEEYASYGQYDQAIALMLAGMKKDALRHADDAKLHLGLAYLHAGRKPDAVRVLRTVGGTEGAAEIARLWILQIGTGK